MLKREELITRLLALPGDIERQEAAYAAAVHAQAQREAAAVLHGEVNGKNETERKAQLALLLQEWEQATTEQRLLLHARQNEFAALRSVARLLAGEDRDR